VPPLRQRIFGSVRRLSSSGCRSAVL
jgi:hypothetical protein